MTPGEPFIPYKQFRGALIPEGLLKFSGVCRGASLLYGQLARYAGKNGVCFPGQARLAEELRATPRTVQRWTRQLVDLGLLRRQRRGAGTRTNSYVFLWSEVLGRQLAFDFGPHLAIVTSNGIGVTTGAVQKPVENSDNLGGRAADAFRAEFAGLVEKSAVSVQISEEKPVDFLAPSRQKCRVSDEPLLIVNEGQFISRSSSISVESESPVENSEPNTVRSVDEQSVLEEDQSEATAVATETSSETGQERTESPEATRETTKRVREALSPAAAPENCPGIRRTVAGSVAVRSDRNAEGRQFASAGDVLIRFASFRELLAAGLADSDADRDETRGPRNETAVLRDEKVA